jgi:hypothetical protein
MNPVTSTTLMRNIFEGVVGVGLSLLVSLTVLSHSLFELGYFGPLLFTVVGILVNWAIGLIQIKRTFKTMGWATIEIGRAHV